jgi:hypothetical protein
VGRRWRRQGRLPVVVVVVVGMIVGSLKEVAVEIRSGNRTEVYNDKSIDYSKPVSSQRTMVQTQRSNSAMKLNVEIFERDHQSGFQIDVKEVHDG